MKCSPGPSGGGRLTLPKPGGLLALTVASQAWLPLSLVHCVPLARPWWTLLLTPEFVGPLSCGDHPQDILLGGENRKERGETRGRLSGVQGLEGELGMGRTGEERETGWLLCVCVVGVGQQARELAGVLRLPHSLQNVLEASFDPLQLMTRAVPLVRSVEVFHTRPPMLRASYLSCCF